MSPEISALFRSLNCMSLFHMLLSQTLIQPLGNRWPRSTLFHVNAIPVADSKLNLALHFIQAAGTFNFKSVA